MKKGSLPSSNPEANFLFIIFLFHFSNTICNAQLNSLHFSTQFLSIDTSVNNNELIARSDGGPNGEYKIVGVLTELNGSASEVVGSPISGSDKLKFTDLNYSSEYAGRFNISVANNEVFIKQIHFFTDGNPRTAPTQLRPVFITKDKFQVQWNLPPNPLRSLALHYLEWNDAKTSAAPAVVNITLGTNATTFEQTLFNSRVKIWLSANDGTEQSAPLILGSLDTNGDDNIENLSVNRSSTGAMQLNLWFAKNWTVEQSLEVAAVTHDGHGKCNSLLLLLPEERSYPDIPKEVFKEKLCSKEEPVTVEVLKLTIAGLHGSVQLSNQTLSERLSVFTFIPTIANHVTKLQSVELASTNQIMVRWRPMVWKALNTYKFTVKITDQDNQCFHLVLIQKIGTRLEAQSVIGNACLPDGTQQPFFPFTGNDITKVAASNDAFFSLTFSPALGSTYKFSVLAHSQSEIRDHSIRTNVILTTPTPVASVPSIDNLTVRNLYLRVQQLSWNKPNLPNPIAYKLTYWEDGPSSSKRTLHFLTNESSYVVYLEKSNTLYRYQMSIVTLPDGRSNVKIAETQCKTMPARPHAPVSATASADTDDSTVWVDWQKNTAHEAFNITHYLVKSEPPLPGLPKIVDANETSIVIKVQPSTFYVFSVQTMDQNWEVFSDPTLVPIFTAPSSSFKETKLSRMLQENLPNRNAKQPGNAITINFLLNALKNFHDRMQPRNRSAKKRKPTCDVWIFKRDITFNIKENQIHLTDTDCNGPDWCDCAPLELLTEYRVQLRIAETHTFDEDAKRRPMVISLVLINFATVLLITIASASFFVQKRPQDVQLFSRQPESETMEPVREIVRPQAIRTDEFVRYAQQYLSPNDNTLENQFAQLQQISSENEAQKVLTRNDGSSPRNRSKNRYNDIVPYDQTRVPLGSEGGNDYINANFVYRIEHENVDAKELVMNRNQVEFIATQAPLESTIGDFWEMVIEQNCSLIVMLTNLQEGGKTKSRRYWPVELNATEIYSGQKTDTAVAFLSEEEQDSTGSNESFVTIRKFRVSSAAEFDRSMTVTQLHFTAWPDLGAPKLSAFEKLMKSYDELLRQSGNQNTVTLVHCSAGVGRTGTFIAAHILRRGLSAGDKWINIYEIVHNLRLCRCPMVQKPVQYKFLHQYAIKLLKTNTEQQS